MENTIDDVQENIATYAIHLINNCSEKQLHQKIGELFADREAMIDWKLSERDYFTAIEIAYFAPSIIKTRVH
jgi:hypothetical protein